ncbi:MAG: hypothetical protein R2750_03885 [Bacteroidales bacterium]
MKRLTLLILVFAFPVWIYAQQTATIKINNMHIEINGNKVDFDESYEFTLTDGVMSSFILFDQNEMKYGHEFQYKKGTNRLKLVRRGYASKNGLEPKFAKQKKDMQEIKVSIPGSISKRVVDNIVVDKENLDAINVSFNYELIYKQ